MGARHRIGTGENLFVDPSSLKNLLLSPKEKGFLFECNKVDVGTDRFHLIFRGGLFQKRK